MANQGIEKGSSWHFGPHSGQEIGPNEPMQINFKKNPYQSLVRESIQNSLDVCLDTERPVHVSFAIGKMRSTSYPNFFELKKHIQGCLDYYGSNHNATATYGPMLDILNKISKTNDLYYIKVSDSNTLGMRYNPESTDSPFYAFVRSAGVSAKGDSMAGGSYGFGKAAFFYISPIRTIIVSTKTSESKCYFEGVSALCTHRTDGEKLTSVGYYDNNEGNPMTNIADIPDQFNKKNDEPGTDIYILGIDVANKEEIFTEMAEAVLRNFWMAIYAGRLTVTINKSKEEKEEYTTKTLGNYITSYFKGENIKATEPEKYNPLPYYLAVAETNNSKNHRIDDQLDILGNVTLYIREDKDARDNILYMRQQMMLVKADRPASQYGYYGIFICTDPQGNEKLRQMENPAHNEWRPGNWKNEKGHNHPTGKKIYKEEIPNFINKSIEQIFNNGSNLTDEISGLNEFLYIPEDWEEDKTELPPNEENTDEDSNLPTTEIDEIKKRDSSDTPQGETYGTVIVETNNTTGRIDPEGEQIGGHGTSRRTPGEGGGLTAHGADTPISPDGTDIKGKFGQIIPVTYRAFAQTRNNRTIHILIVHAQQDYERVNIAITICGEDENDKIGIVSSSAECRISENELIGLTLHEGKNKVEIEFEDTMKHSIILKAYES